MTPEELRELREAKRLLLELLAVIHRDGGHHVDQHGVEKSVSDAFAVVSELRGFMEGNHNYRVFYEELVSKVVGDYGQLAAVNGPVLAGHIAAAKVQDAFEALRAVRASLLMRLGRGEERKQLDEVGGTPEGLARAVDAVEVRATRRGRAYERALVESWLSKNPQNVNMELAYSGENPYLWLVHALRLEMHDADDSPF